MPRQSKDQQQQQGTSVDLSDKNLPSLDLSSFQSFSTVERAALEKVTSLDISHNSLRDLPVELSSVMPRLTQVNISHNYLGDLIQQQHQTNGRSCSSSTSTSTSCKLSYLPRVTLTHLDVSHNRLSSITELLSLTKLKFLDVSHNRIMSFGICRQVSSNTKPFPFLLELRLNNNWVKSLRGIETLTSLRVVDASCNSISFREDIVPLEQLPNLKECSLEGNPLFTNAAKMKNNNNNSKERYNTNNDDDDEEEEEEEEYEDESTESTSLTECTESDIVVATTSPPPMKQQATSPPSRSNTAINKNNTRTVKSGGYAAIHRTPYSSSSSHNNTTTTATTTNNTSNHNITSSSSAPPQSLSSTSHNNNTNNNISAITVSSSATKSSTAATNHDNNNHNNDTEISNLEILLEFERKANEQLRHELDQMKQLLRNTRSAAKDGSTSTRALKQENESLKKKVTALENQAAKDRTEKNALKRRFDERVMKLEQEHKRIVGAQEAEIQELRLELEATVSAQSIMNKMTNFQSPPPHPSSKLSSPQTVNNNKKQNTSRQDEKDPSTRRAHFHDAQKPALFADDDDQQEHHQPSSKKLLTFNYGYSEE